jgi:uncharacterized protein YegJ (DUF2314 family)
MKHRPLIFMSLLALGGCSSPNHPHTVAREVIRPGGDTAVFHITADDDEMRKAVSQARRSVPAFIAAVKNHPSAYRDFEVKKPFIKDGVVEHMWLSGVTYSGGRFHGNVDNKPHQITGVKMGDHVSVNPNEITDWAYVDHGQLVGGYTIRVLYRELSPEQKSAFESEVGFRIGNQ